jgi:pimeloyl-ACP methyl ester carboxylesterase
MATPVLFVHGLWLHATSWQPWIDHFRQAGYEPEAPGWPGEPDTVDAARLAPEQIADHGIEEVTAHFAEQALRLAKAPMGVQPVIVGHSFGGLIVQKLMARGLGSAGIAIDPAPMKGVLVIPASSLKASFPALKNPANKSKAISLTSEQFRYAFGNAVSEEESNSLYERWAIPSPAKPLFQAALANVTPHSEAAVDTKNSHRGPLLITAGGRDHTVPAGVSRATHKRYKHSTATTELLEFPDRGHSLTIDSGWQEVADGCLAWLKANGM